MQKDQILFRPHRGSLQESMDAVVEVESFSALINMIKSDLSQYGHDLEINENTVSVREYHYDRRNGWDTHIVSLERYGVFGFTNRSFAEQDKDVE